MIKKLAWHLWQWRRQFSRYFIIGFSGVFLDMGTIYCFKEFWSLRPVLAVVLNQILIIIYIFILNRYWTFKSAGLIRSQFVRFGILSGGNYLFAIGWMWLWNQVFGFNYLLVRLFNIILSVSWNFLLYKHWVYYVKQKETVVHN